MMITNGLLINVMHFHHSPLELALHLREPKLWVKVIEQDVQMLVVLHLQHFEP